MAIYETLQAILEEAGLQHVELAEEPYGEVNGTNKVFVTHHKPLADANYSDSITPADVCFYVNGSPVKVIAVEPSSGAITLQTAPAVDDTVLVDYRYAPISLQIVDGIREEAQDWIDEEMKGTDPVPYNPVPKKIRLICRTFAAGVLLAREYGFNEDTAETSKDGDARIKRAEKWLEKYKANGGNSDSSSSTGIEDVQVESAGDLFASSKPTDEFASDNDFLRNTD